MLYAFKSDCKFSRLSLDYKTHIFNKQLMAKAAHKYVFYFKIWKQL